MIKNSQNKEFSIKDLVSHKTEDPSKQIPHIMETPERADKEAIHSKEQSENITTKLSVTEHPLTQKIKEKVHIGGKVAISKQQPVDDVQLEIKNIESVLQEGLEETYKKMDPVSQAQFKAQGEDTARAINILLHKTKVKIKEIVALIIKWLKLIPRVNKFFVEQEAKIKADKLMAQKRKKDAEKLK